MDNLRKLILGTVQLGLNYGINNVSGKPDPDAARNILREAYSAGIRFLDTAAAYGNSEEIIGSYHEAFPNEKFSIITKFHASEHFIPAQHITGALDRLRVDHLDTLMFHSYSDFKNHSQITGELVEEKKQGRIRNIGVSLYTNEELDEVIGHPDIDTIQLPFNLFDNEYHRAERMKRAKALGKSVHIRSVFLQGLFFKNPDELQPQLDEFKPYLDRIRAMAKEHQVTLEDFALHYALEKEYIDGVLFGVDTREQLAANIQSAKKPVPKELIAEADKIHFSNIQLLNPGNWQL